MTDSVRRHFLEALARRAQSLQGAARKRLDDRLRQLLAERAQPSMQDPLPVVRAPRPVSPLAALRAHIAQATAARGLPAEAATAPELQAVRLYRRTWAQLGLQQRLRQAQRRVPTGAGPLNTQRLVHEALASMQQSSPAYVHRLMAQVETLLWLEQAGAAADPPAPPRPPAPRPARKKSSR